MDVELDGGTMSPVSESQNVTVTFHAGCIRSGGVGAVEPRRTVLAETLEPIKNNVTGTFITVAVFLGHVQHVRLGHLQDLLPRRGQRRIPRHALPVQATRRAARVGRQVIEFIEPDEKSSRVVGRVC